MDDALGADAGEEVDLLLEPVQVHAVHQDAPARQRLHEPEQRRGYRRLARALGSIDRSIRADHPEKKRTTDEKRKERS